MSYFDNVGLTNEGNQQINPATDETVLLLRRMLQMLAPLATQDASQRQRVVVENTTLVGVTTVTTVTTVTNIAGFGGVDPKYQFMEGARASFASGIRSKLDFTNDFT